VLFLNVELWKMSNTFIFRMNKPSKYGDVSGDDFAQRIINVLIARGYTQCVLVEELGEVGENLHWHGRLSTWRSMDAVRKDFNGHFDVYGNEEFSLKSWDPVKGLKYHRYLAKGPVSQRLVMPRVIVDDIGLMWERLHHEFHDEKLAREARSRKNGVKKEGSFLEELIALCRARSAQSKMQVFDCLRELYGRRLHQMDAFVADKMCWSAWLAVNPVEGFDGLRSNMRFFQ